MAAGPRTTVAAFCTPPSGGGRPCRADRENSRAIIRHLGTVLNETCIELDRNLVHAALLPALFPQTVERTPPVQDNVRR